MGPVAADGRAVRARVVRRDPGHDWALGPARTDRRDRPRRPPLQHRKSHWADGCYPGTRTGERRALAGAPALCGPQAQLSGGDAAGRRVSRHKPADRLGSDGRGGGRPGADHRPQPDRRRRRGLVATGGATLAGLPLPRWRRGTSHRHHHRSLRSCAGPQSEPGRIQTRRPHLRPTQSGRTWTIPGGDLHLRQWPRPSPSRVRGGGAVSHEQRRWIEDRHPLDRVRGLAADFATGVSTRRHSRSRDASGRRAAQVRSHSS